MNLLADLHNFDIRKGKTPIDPMRIEGFGPGEAPPPSEGLGPPQIRSAAEMYGPPQDEPIGVPEPAESPLVALALQAQQRHAQRVQQALETPIFSPPDVAGIVPVQGHGTLPDLYVAEKVGRYRGWEVELNEAERNAIIAVIHGAFRRRMETQFEQVTGRPMRRPRTRAAVVEPTPRRRRRRGTPDEHPET